MKHRDWLHKRAIRDCSSITWDMYKAARNKVTSEIKKSKATDFNINLTDLVHDIVGGRYNP